MVSTTKVQNGVIRAVSALTIMTGLTAVTHPVWEPISHTLSNPYNSDPAIAQYEEMEKVLNKLQSDLANLEAPRNLNVEGNKEKNLRDLETAYNIPTEKLDAFTRLINGQEIALSNFYIWNPNIRNNEMWEAETQRMLSDGADGAYILGGMTLAMLGMSGWFGGPKLNTHRRRKIDTPDPSFLR